MVFWLTPRQKLAWDNAPWKQKKCTTLIAIYIVCTRHLCFAVVIYIQCVTPTACLPVLERSIPPLQLSSAFLLFSMFRFLFFWVFPPQMFAAAGRKNRVCSRRECETHFAGNWFLRTCAIQIKSDSIDWYSGMCARHSGSMEANGTLIYRAVPHLRACEKSFQLTFLDEFGRWPAQTVEFKRILQIFIVAAAASCVSPSSGHCN